jgi:hypothetical protein
MMGTMGRRTVNKLFDLEFDEVSSVDRPANQHGLIAFSKALDTQEGDMTAIFTETGVPVAEDELEHGDVVYDASGQEYVFVEDEPEEGDEPAEPADEVGKGALSNYVKGAKAAVGGWKEPGLGAAGARGGKSAKHVMNNKGKYAAGAAGVGGFGLGAGGSVMVGEKSASLGDTVLESLSKAVTSAERDEVVAKMADEVQFAKAQADAAMELLEQERDIRITEAFVAKAAEYNLPVPDEQLGRILKSVTMVLDDEDLELLDQLLTFAGESAMFDEVGAAGGGSNSGVLDEVNALAGELVGKSAGDFSQEQAMVALFANNPGAYDAYLAEQNGR